MTHGARRLLAESPAPRMDVARGFAVTAVEELLERFAAEPHTAEVDLGEQAGALRVLRWQLDPAVAEVAAPEPLEIDGAAIRTPAGTVLVDSRAAPASLRFAHAGRSLEVSIERGHVRLYALASAELPAFEPRVATGGRRSRGGSPSTWRRSAARVSRSTRSPPRARSCASSPLPCRMTRGPARRRWCAACALGPDRSTRRRCPGSRRAPSSARRGSGARSKRRRSMGCRSRSSATCSRASWSRRASQVAVLRSRRRCARSTARLERG